MMRAENKMATTPTPPAPRPHHGYKSWTSTWYDQGKHRRTKRFGKCDEVSKRLATARYLEWMNREWKPKQTVLSSSGETWTIAHIAGCYWEECKKIYVKNGKQTSTLDNIKLALQTLIDNHGAEDANTFGAPQLTTLGNLMCKSKNRHGETVSLSLSTVNARIQTIRRMYKWARTKGWVTRESAADVVMTPLLRKGRCEATSGKKVLPVPDAILAATMAQAPRTICDMIRVQLLTGMRSGELCHLKPCLIEKAETLWIYRPPTHKTEHHGRDRVIVFGPQVQEILSTYIMRREWTDYVFLPSEAHRERLEMIGTEAQIAYQISRSTFKPGRRFRADTYKGMIDRACDRAFDADGKKRAQRDYSHRWTPHRLRHNAATTLRQQFGVEAAQNVLGHSQVNTTLIYAERSLEQLKDIARKVG